MWIFCCGMLRSASTLQFQITSRLVKDAELGIQVGWIDWKRFDEVRQTYQNEPRLKVVKVHVCGDAIVSEFQHNNAKGIYIFRDIRDVYVSYVKQRQKSFEFLWNEGLVETCLDNYKAWTSLPNVLISKYDDVMVNPAKEVRHIAEHLGIAISVEDSEKIAADYEMSEQQKRIEEFKLQLLQNPSIQANKDRDIVDYHDEENLLHMNHISSGKIGQWQSELTAEQVDLIEEKVKDWCNDNQVDATIFLSSHHQVFASSQVSS
jgi:hypothetical protein